MAWKRVIYAVILLASVTAFIVTDSAIALFFMLSVVAMPIVSLLLLTVAKRRIKFDFYVRESCIRGGALEITMKAKVAPRLLVGFVKVTVDVENTTFSKTERKFFSFNDLSFAPHVYDYVSADSGRIIVTVKNIKLIDIFGICTANVSCAKYAESFVSPKLYEDTNIRIDANGSAAVLGEMSVPVRGQDPTEIFDIRDFADGDSLRSVHWKLSSKLEELKIKEFGSTDNRKTLILVDLSRTKNDISATDLQLNCVLDVAISVSSSLKTDGYMHSVGWFNDGVFSCSDVSDNASFVQMVDELMSIKVENGNAETMFYLSRSPECAVFTKIIYISASLYFGDLKKYMHADITALAVGDGNVTVNERGIRIVDVPCDDVCAALVGCVL